jgi:hypothetical protein
MLSWNSNTINATSVALNEARQQQCHDGSGDQYQQYVRAENVRRLVFDHPIQHS